MKNVVSTFQGRLGAKSGEYVCLDCGFIITANMGGKGYYFLKEDEMICPACSSRAKQPTPAPNADELEKRKAEIKDRLK